VAAARWYATRREADPESPLVAALVAIATGGVIGALVVAGLAEGLPSDRWPVGTLVVNITGTVLLAVVAAIIARRPSLPHWFHPFAAVGFCGSLTTFSGIQIEALALLRKGMSGITVLYVTEAILLGPIAIVATRRMMARVIRGACFPGRSRPRRARSGHWRGSAPAA